MMFGSVSTRFNLCKRLISVFTAQVFVLSSIAFAAPGSDSQDILKPQGPILDPEKIVIPAEEGLVKSKFTGNPGKLLIHIQDAHCNFEAQTNIAKILENLIKNYGLSLVSVEGADGLIDTTWFKAFPDEEVRREVATYFMKKGEITGPEYLSITTNYPIKLFGAETRSYYIENLNAFTSSYPLKADTEKYFNTVKAALNKLKDYVYTPELKLMDLKQLDYESKKIQFNDYIRFLQETAEKNKINLRQYANLFKLVSVLIYEKKIDFNQTDKERNTLIDELSKKLSKDALTELVAQSMAFKVGKLSSTEYYSYLRSLAMSNEIDVMDRFPNLYNYIIYNAVYSRIENEKLFHDIRELETAIKEKLFANDDQRILEKLSRHIDILLGLVNIKLLNGDFEYFKARKAEFSHTAFADFIMKRAAQFGLVMEVDEPAEAVAGSISKLEDFYAIAIKRDKALVDNTINEMAKQKQGIAVLVTGGFHSEGIARLLEKQGISYMVVCPSITKDTPSPYIQILTNQRTPIEDILAPQPDARRGMLAPILRTQLAPMSPKEAREFLSVVPVKNEEVRDLINSIIKGSSEFKEDWFSAAISGWFRKVMPSVRGHKLAQEMESMKSAYTTGMRLGLARCIMEDPLSGTLSKEKVSRLTNQIVEGITETAEFTAAFEKAFNRASQTSLVGAIRAKGGELTVKEHGPRTSTMGAELANAALTDMNRRGEATVNGIIQNKIEAGQARSLRIYNKTGAVSDEYIKPWEASDFRVDRIFETNYMTIRKWIVDYTNIVIIKGLKDELIARGVAPDLILHPGVTRRSMYIDEADFVYLLSLPDGADLLIEAFKHEQTHIDNPNLSEEEIEKLAPTKNVRKALTERQLIQQVQKLSRVDGGIVAGTGLSDIHGRKFIPDGRFFTPGGNPIRSLARFMDSLDEASVREAIEAGIMYYDIRSPFWREHPELTVAIAFAFAKKLQEKTGQKDGIILHIGVDCYQKHFEAAQIFADAILRTGICDNGGGIYYWGVINGGDMRNYGQLYDAKNGAGGNWVYFTMSHRAEDYLGAKLGIDARVYCGSDVRHCEGVTSGTLYDAIVEKDYASIGHARPEDGTSITIANFLPNNIQVAADMIRATSASEDTPTNKLLAGARLCVDMNGSPIGKNLVDMLTALGADVLVENGKLEPDYRTEHIVDPNEHRSPAVQRLKDKAERTGRVVLAVDPDGDRGSIVAVGPDGKAVSLSGAKLLLLSMEQLANSYHKKGKSATVISDMRTGVSAHDLGTELKKRGVSIKVVPHEAGYPFFMRGMAALPADLAVENTTHAFTNPMTNRNWGAPRDYTRPDGAGYQGGDNAALYLIYLLGCMVHQWEGRNPAEQLDWIERNYNLRPTVDDERKPALAKEDDKFKYMIAERMKELAGLWFRGDKRFLINFGDPNVRVVSGVHVTNTVTGAMMLVRFSNTGASFTISGEAYRGAEGHERDELNEMLGLGHLLITTAVEQLRAEGHDFKFDIKDAANLAGKFDVSKYFPQGFPTPLRNVFDRSDKVALLGNAEVATYEQLCGAGKVVAIPHGFFNIDPQAAVAKDLTVSVIGSVTTWSDMRWVGDVIGLMKEIRKQSPGTKALGYIAGKFVPYRNPNTGNIIDELNESKSNPECIVLKAEEIESAYKQPNGFTDLASFKAWLWERSAQGAKVIIVEGEIKNKELGNLQTSLIDFNTQMYRELLNGFKPKVEYSGTLHENPGSSIPVVFESPSMADVESEGISMVAVKFDVDGNADFFGAAQSIIELIKNSTIYNAQRVHSLTAAKRLAMAEVASRYLDLARRSASKKAGEAIRIGIVTP